MDQDSSTNGPARGAAGMAELAARGAALIVVDLQNEFCHPDGFYGRQGRSLRHITTAVSNTARLLATARALSMPRVFTTITFDTRLPRLEQRHAIIPPGITPGQRLVPGSWGAAVVDELAPREDEFVVDKSDFSAFYETNLESLLRRLEVKVVILTGVLTNACLMHTAYDAFVRDLDVVIASDTVASWTDELTNSALKILGSVIGQVATTDGLLESERIAVTSG